MDQALQRLLHDIRMCKRVNRVLQAIECFIAALALYAAIGCFLYDEPFVGVVCSVVAFMRFSDFDHSQRVIARLRDLERRVRQSVRDTSDVA